MKRDPASRLAATMARTLVQHTVGQDHQQYVNLCNRVADVLATTYKRFDRAMFLSDCGVENDQR